MPYDIALKRVYEAPSAEDGARVLVDRLWPRGKQREGLALHDWYRTASPSSALRRDWHAQRIDRATFTRRYRQEIADSEACLVPLMTLARQGRLTLLSAARDLQRSHLPVLREAVIEALREEDYQADGGISSPPCYAAEFNTDYRS